MIKTKKLNRQENFDSLNNYFGNAWNR